MYCRYLSGIRPRRETGRAMYSPQPLSQSVYFRVCEFFLVTTALLFGLAPQSMAGSTPQLTSSPSSVRFGSVVVGQSSTVHVAVTNSGSTSVTISSVDSTASGFAVGNLSLPLTLTAGQSVDFDITFTPAGNGWSGGSINLASNASNKKLYIRVGGTGVVSEALSASPAALAFGNVAVGKTATLPVTLTNTGKSNIVLALAETTGTGFAWSGATLPVNIPSKQSITLNVTFTPPSAGADAGTLVLHNGGLTVGLSGTGGVAALSISPSTVSFGDVAVGSSESQPMTLSASGGDVTINSASSSSAQFTLTGATFPVTIPSGQSASFSVVFSPTKTGAAAGNVSLSSSTSTSQVLEPLTGNGTQVQHNVNLNWSPSTSTVTGYNIYRATTSKGPYSRINSSLNTDTSYTDSTVSSGTTYYYAATSVDSTGTESSYSTLAQAVIP